MNKDLNILDDEVIFGHRRCQTREVKWILIEKFYEKCFRPNFYDIGGSYAGDVADLWFNFKTEIIGEIFLVHLFVVNRLQGQVNLSISCKNNILLKKKHHSAFLTSAHKTYEFDDAPALTCNYILTYSFSEADVELLKDLKLYISVTLRDNDQLGSHVKDSVLKTQDFKALLNDPVCSDFVIESADGVKFNVHEIILSANSEVFKAMLKENTAESQNRCMKMVDVEGKDLSHIIHFIYTGTLENLENCNFINLMMLGDKYNIKGLIELCKHGLMCQLNKKNVFEILVIADLCNCEELKIAALKYIKNYKVKLDNSMFQELNNIKLIKELCTFLSSSS